MSNIIQFKHPPVSSPVQAQLDKYIATLAEIEAGRTQIETDIRFVESVMIRTKNSHLHAITLQRLGDIKNQLLVASLKLLDAQRGLQGLAASTGIADPSARSHSADAEGQLAHN
jgi:hypothetical protein